MGPFQNVSVSAVLYPRWPPLLVVHRSSETLTNQSDVIIRSDDRFLNLVVDSDSIVSKIYMLCSLVGFFFCLHTDKNIAVLSQLGFFALILTNIWQLLKIEISSNGQNCSILSQNVPKFELYKHNDELFNMYYRIFYEL